LYYETFERRGSDAAVRGIAFFFGIAFIIEVLIILQFGVDQRTVSAPYIGKALRLGEMRIPYRQLVAFAVALSLTALLALYLSKTFMGRAIRAVAQDEEALRLMGANPLRVKQLAFAIATGVLGIAGALLIIITPVEPALDRAYIGRTFCVVVMAGLGSIPGGAAGYVNFGTNAFFGVGIYTAVFLTKAYDAPLLVQILVAAAVGALLGGAVGLLTLRMRGIFFSIATIALAIIIETLVINWRFVGGAAGIQLQRPPVMAPFDTYVKLLFMVQAVLVVVAVATARG